MAATKGTATVDFGSTPTDYGEFTVTDVTLAGLTYCEAFFMSGDSTTDNDSQAHEQAAYAIRCICAAPIGNDMLVKAFLEQGLVAKTFKLRYVGA